MNSNFVEIFYEPKSIYLLQLCFAIDVWSADAIVCVCMGICVHFAIRKGICAMVNAIDKRTDQEKEGEQRQ